MLDVFPLRGLPAMANNCPCLSPSQQPSSKLTDDSFRPHTVFLAWPQGASQFLDTFRCLAGTFVFLVFILVLIPSFSDILVNLSPCQGFDLFICFYSLQIPADTYQTSCSQLVS